MGAWLLRACTVSLGPQEPEIWNATDMMPSRGKNGTQSRVKQHLCPSRNRCARCLGPLCGSSRSRGTASAMPVQVAVALAVPDAAGVARVVCMAVSCGGAGVKFADIAA